MPARGSSMAEAELLLHSNGHLLCHVLAKRPQSSQWPPLVLQGPVVQVAGLCSSCLYLLGHQINFLHRVAAIQVVHGLCRPQEANR